MTSPDPSLPGVPRWLKSLPLAPEYHPTPAEFQDPISYILKIEKEASHYGICKIVPPLPAPPRKTVISNINRSFTALGGDKGANLKRASPSFTTRQQQIGLCPRRSRPALKPVWQSGEEYSLAQFEAKAKQFERTMLRRCGRKSNGRFTELEVESLFWRAASDKPIVVEYANDIPGSGFAPRLRSSLRKWKEEDAGDVGDTAWNMRGVSREKGSLLKFMKEEIPGVTSPMVYIAMMFSWFAWHVEDHELHSLNYLHMGAGKTWYGVPRDARFAFEELVRVEGYGEYVNPLATFALLGEKTTVMSPERALAHGIPCCRLVQNAGDFVVTFPGSYHCGFSHGYNIGEASNIATPEWLKVAKEAAIRRASINVPPMVSHFQLLYELAMSLWSRITLSRAPEPRSSRVKDKLKGEGEVLIKEIFVQSIMENNNLLDALLGKGSSCVILPQNGFGVSFSSNSQSRYQMKIKAKPSLDSCNHKEVKENSREAPLYEPIPDKVSSHRPQNYSSSVKRKNVNGVSFESSMSSETQSMHHEKEGTLNGEGLLDQGLLSCVTCGILSFACVAVVQPTTSTAGFLMLANSGTFMDVDELVRTGENCPGRKHANLKSDEKTGTQGISNNNCEVFDDNLDQTDDQVDASDHTAGPTSDSAARIGASALDLLASVYGDLSSDAEEENVEDEELHSEETGFKKEVNPIRSGSNIMDFTPTARLSSKLHSGHEFDHSQVISSSRDAWEHSPDNMIKCTELIEPKLEGVSPTEESPGQSSNGNRIDNDFDQCQSERDCVRFGVSRLASLARRKSTVMLVERPVMENNLVLDAYMDPNTIQMRGRPDKDSCRMHVFCLAHALEVEKQLSSFGGVNVMLLCHPDYPKIETQAKLASKELGISYTWKGINFREATEKDQEIIQSALEDEEAVPTCSDWTVKMGINLYYSASLSNTSIYSTQIPYNRVIYKAFSRSLSSDSLGDLKVFDQGCKKSVVAGRWCGKVWMSNQINPHVIRKIYPEDEEFSPNKDPVVEDVPKGMADNAQPVKVPTENALDVVSPYSKTFSRKRKKKAEDLNAKKPRHDQQDCNGSTANLTGKSLDLGKTVRRSARTVRTATTLLDSELHDSGLDVDLKSGPDIRLRSRSLTKDPKTKPTTEKQLTKRKRKQQPVGKKTVESNEVEEYPCDLEGCTMSFSSKQDLALHKRNVCPVKGCGKKFFSHKYLVQHRRVHTDDRPLKCPWKGCKMAFKWAWARTEHIRVHTGDRPYICMVGGCGQTFRFVSDFSRHKRKTGHVSKKVRR